MSETVVQWKNCLTYALDYAKRGWQVIPVHTVIDGQCSCGSGCPEARRGKHPRTPNGILAGSIDPDVIRGWWSRWPDAQVGIVTGRVSNLCIIDCDPRNGGPETWQHCVMTLSDGECSSVMVDTGGGGWHLYLSHPGGHVSLKCLGKGLDVKCDGGFVVAPPSVHKSGKSYTFRHGANPNEVELAPPPAWMLNMLRPATDKPAATQPATVESGYLLAAFSAAGWARKHLSKGHWAVKCPWASEHTGGDGKDSSTVIFPPAEGSTMGAFHCSHAHCSERTLRDVLAMIPQEAKQQADRLYPNPAAARTLPRGPAPPVTHDADGVVDEPETNLDDTLAYNAKGVILKNVHNVASIIRLHEEWKGVVAGNVLSGYIDFRKPPPWRDAQRPNIQGKTWQDEDDIRLQMWVSKEYKLEVSKSVCNDAVMVVAGQSLYNPVLDMLSTLKWDGIQRIPGWLTTYMGAEDSPYVRAVGTRWLIQLVARQYNPGCRADGVLILEGTQGIRKSTGLSVLVGHEHFADNVGDINSKDAMQVLRGKWLIEIGELSSHNRAESGAWKRYISTPYDVYRPSYGRATIEVPRTCVFAASTNQHVYGKDETGARRDWGVRVRLVDVEGLQRDREQLLIEAVTRYQAGERYWLEGTEAAQQEERQEQARDCDAWEDAISVWVKEQNCKEGELKKEGVFDGGPRGYRIALGKSLVTVNGALECLGVELCRRDRPMSIRIGAIFRHLGLSPKGEHVLLATKDAYGAETITETKVKVFR